MLVFVETDLFTDSDYSALCNTMNSMGALSIPLHELTIQCAVQLYIKVVKNGYE